MSADRAHELKVWPPFFDALADGSKTFEVRKDDRGIEPGDLLRLREWDPADSGVPRIYEPVGYSGREVTLRVGYILRGLAARDFGIARDCCVLALLPAPPARPAENLGSAHPSPHPQGGTETLRAENERLRTLVGEEGQPGWDSCSRAEAIRQAETTHASLLSYIDACDSLREQVVARTAERDALRALLAAAPAPTE